VDDDRRSRLTGFAGSLLLHALIVVPFLILSPLGNAPAQRRGSDGEAVVVTLLPLDGTAEGAATPPLARPSAKDDALTETSPVSVESNATLASETPNSSTPIAATSGASPANGTASAPTNDDIRNYQRVLLLHIERYRGYPVDERSRRVEGTVLVRFAMNRQGSVLDAWVDRSSGVIALDDEAIATVHRAQPLPLIPASLPDRLSIVLPVSFSVQ